MKKDIISTAKSVVFFPTIRKSGAKFCETNILNELYETEYKLSDGQRVHKRINDVTILFNQDRISQSVGVDTINAWLKTMNNVSTDSFAELRKHVKDDELLDFVKSRHIQTLSELQLWSNYLSSEYEKEISEIEKSQTIDVDTQPIENDTSNVE